VTADGARPRPAPTEPGPRRSRARFALLLGLCLAFFALFVALGVWQVHRLSWKLALIARVDARVHAAPVPAPGPAAWPAITADKGAYRRVTVTGRYENDRETLVQANTELGPGFWVLTPFDTARGFTLLVNRGFVPPEHRASASRADGQIAGRTTVTGLLRMSEPGGAFLRHNDPAHDRWFSRDVAAIAKARGLGAVAPYFIDAGRAALPADAPVGGLTVIHFRNAHLQYALTWFGLAIVALVGAVLTVRDRFKRR
jgi:surfeit locus 1 family protein